MAISVSKIKGLFFGLLLIEFMLILQSCRASGTRGTGELTWR
jgi:hypothetical protein